MNWRVRTMASDEWTALQNRAGELPISAHPDFGMFEKGIPGETEAEIFLTGPGIELLERLSPGRWEDSSGPEGRGVALLIAGSPAAHFGVELSL